MVLAIISPEYYQVSILKIQEGEFVAIAGFSGSGKTTLISSIAGLITPDLGEVLFKGKNVTGPSPERGIVFQSYSLMPWLTVYGNIALAVDEIFSHWPTAKRKRYIHEYIDMAAELSGGGMRQCVTVARAMAMQPEMLLLDEPLSTLDVLTRSKLQDGSHSAGGPGHHDD